MLLSLFNNLSAWVTAFLSFIPSLLILVLILLVLVLIHEFGHFFMAKRFGIKVLEFGFGIPPRIWGKKIGETIYSLNWFPVGGFVRLLGEDEDEETLKKHASSQEWQKRAFSFHPVWQRILVVVAGVFMNLILAWALFYIVLGANSFKYQVELRNNFHFLGVEQQNEHITLVYEVLKDSPADQAGLKVGDRILKLNGETVTNSNQLSEFTEKYGGQKATMTLSDLNGENLRRVEVTPLKNPPADKGALGILRGEVDQATLVYQKWWQKLLAGPIQSLNMAYYSVVVLGSSIGSSVHEGNLKDVSQKVGGIVAIGYITNTIVRFGTVINLLDMMAELSLTLAIMNILPIPALDGGRLFFLIVEAVTRKKVNPTLERYVHTIGLAILIGLIFLITYSDIRKFIL